MEAIFPYNKDMAIQFKSEEQRQAEKQVKDKLHKARTILMICAIAAFVILLLYFTVSFSPQIVILPLFFFWFLVVVIPSVVTVGIIWTNEGYKNFVKNVTNLLGHSVAMLEDSIKVIWKSLPYVGSALLLVIIAYGVISFLKYKRNKEEKKNFYHLIGASVLFILALLVFILALVLLPKVKVN